MKGKLLSLVGSCISNKDFILKSEDSKDMIFDPRIGYVNAKTGINASVSNYSLKSYRHISNTKNLNSKEHTALEKEIKDFFNLTKYDQESINIDFVFRDQPKISITRKLDQKESNEVYIRKYKKFGFINSESIHNVIIIEYLPSYVITCGEIQYDIDVETVENIYKNFLANKEKFKQDNFVHIIEQRIQEFGPKK